MNVLLATDGSSSAQVAEQLVSSTSWPEGTRITAVRVHPLTPGMRGEPESIYLALYEDARRRIDEHLEALATELSRTGRHVDVRMVNGRPASEIAAEAKRIAADLVVIGSRGHGAIASTIIGSVAAEVIDHAPSPVLVARVPRITSIVVAEDGSEGARHAEELASSWSFLRGRPVHVVSVVDLAPFTVGMSSEPAMVGADAYQRMLDEMRQMHEGYAQAAASRWGTGATSEVREGFITQEVVAAAADAKADLIVVGSRGQTGLARLVLGSVARGVLFHAPVSVLVVRQEAHAKATAA